MKRFRDFATPSYDHRIPLFFKLWFAFIALMMILIFGGAGFLIVKTFNDPASIGQFLGQVVSGYNQVMGQ